MINQYLQESLIKGYISGQNVSRQELLPELLTNDTDQHRKVLTTIIRGLEHCDEFWFSVAFVTTSGVAALMNTLIELHQREIKGRIVASNYLNFTQPLALERLINNFPNIEVRVAEVGDFHAKGYLFRKNQTYNMIIGSSNLTSAALSKNKEWNLKIVAKEESYIMRSALREFQSEFDKATPVTNDWIDVYRKIYEHVRLQRWDTEVSEGVGEDVAIGEDVVIGESANGASADGATDSHGEIEGGVDGEDVTLEDDTAVQYSATREINTTREINATSATFEYEQSTWNKVKPNLMQVEALANLQKLRNEGATKALLISATGTGKTYLSAFDAATFNPKRCLFIVHRRNIAKAAMKTFKKVITHHKTFGLYSGLHRDSSADYLFTTIQTLSRDEHLQQFHPDDFDYIVVDETHRAGADTYKKVLNYFTPKFLLGMTATPERTDGWDIFSLYDHKIAYEIRLHRALEEDMLSEFHYYGVQDITVDGRVLQENSDFRHLAAGERINHILETSEKYGTDNGVIRGLVFCSRIEECTALSRAFNHRGYQTVALTGSSSEDARVEAIERLESDGPDRLDYIFTVDIFNEGVDIPKVNQVIMLRPTNSAIIFVQQMGRGLRKVKGKQYLTIIDFIGNYQNNYLVPIALYGDTSYKKDNLRKLVAGGSRQIPGASTINFDRVTKDRIYRSINAANMQLKRGLVKDYDLLKYKLGRHPMMMDFLEHGARDPYHYVAYTKESFYAFAAAHEKELEGLMTDRAQRLLRYFSKEINNAKRVEESLILHHLLMDGYSSANKLAEDVWTRFGYTPGAGTYESAFHNVRLKYATERQNGRIQKIALIHDFEVLQFDSGVFPTSNAQDMDQGATPGPDLTSALEQEAFRTYLLDNIHYAIQSFAKDFNPDHYIDGFVRYRKYSRKDCFRILNWEEEPLAQNVGGYMFHAEDANCPIFVNYHKEDEISDTTKYEDGFLDPATIVYMSKSRRRLESADVQKFRKAQELSIRLPLFIKKENAEGDDFYYMGDVTPVPDQFTQTTIGEDQVPVVKMMFTLDEPVERSLYEYITNGDV